MGEMSDLPAGDVLGLLTVGTSVVAELREGAVLPASLVPRPHLHPVRTVGGLLVTEDEPDDHRHHLGVGAAVPLVEDTNLWGGPTFVSGTGYVDLHDHGRQDVVTCREADDGFRLDVSWVDRAGDRLLSERRHVTGRPVPGWPGAWVLRHSTRLRNPLGRPVVLASPGATGRAGRGLRRGLLARPDLGPGPDRARPRGHRRARGQRRRPPLGAAHRCGRDPRAALERAVRADR